MRNRRRSDHIAALATPLDLDVDASPISYVAEWSKPDPSLFTNAATSVQ